MLKQTEDGIIAKIKIVPNSSQNDIILEDEFIKIKVTAQPIENKANKALVEFLSKKFKIPKTAVKIIKGETSREKTILFQTADNVKQLQIISQLSKE